MTDRNRDWMRGLPNGKAISALGFGCSSVWAKAGFPEDRAQTILDAATAEGINHFDTSPSYGRGHGERRLGLFLKDRDPAAFVISTKVGSNLIDGEVVRGFGRDLMRRSFDRSLQRLGVDRVDILYLHGPALRDLDDDMFGFFSELKAEGRISYSGVNSFDAAVLDRAAETPIDAVMLQYNAGDLSAAPQIERLSGAGKVVISGTALARAKFALRALLPRDRASFWYLLRMLRHEPTFFIEGPRLGRRLSRSGKPPAEAALQFVTGHPNILSNLFGTSRVAHVIENARAGHGALTDEQWQGLNGGPPPI